MNAPTLWAIYMATAMCQCNAEHVAQYSRSLAILDAIGTTIG
jgi:hypothetical protein